MRPTNLLLISMCAAAAVLLSVSAKPNHLSGEDRVARARKLAGEQVKQRFQKVGLNYPPSQLYIRAFKHEKTLEIWSKGSNKKFVKVAEFPIAGMSGTLGPKWKEGDRQVPEGRYFIDRYNPYSRFRLSLGINYPNAADKARSPHGKLGGDIFIHGNTVSIGCLAMTDPLIDEIYLMALDATSRPVRVDIFPFRPEKSGEFKAPDAATAKLWRELTSVARRFAESGIL